MKVYIPMAGRGKRFLAAGYTSPKPLIEVDGMPILEHIIRNFSPDDDFVFGVNDEHLGGNLQNLLLKLAPGCRIEPMPYQPEGPIRVLENMLEHEEEDRPVTVNYCDFSWVWDYGHFKKTVAENGCDGAVVCYRGFHPHLLGPNLYATIDAEGAWAREIREKHSWHADKMDDWTSSGTYYFKSTRVLQELCRGIRDHDAWRINGEFYVSQLYQLMLEKGMKVFVYEIPRMLQWGTPEDLEEYNYWSAWFRREAEEKESRPVRPMDVLILMAGEGKRFSEAGYREPKPLIPAGGTPIVAASTASLPRGDRYFFAVRRELMENDALKKNLPADIAASSVLIPVEKLTEGQACTALLAENHYGADRPLLIGACDHGLQYDEEKLGAIMEEADALIFTFRHFPPVRRSPQAYGWVDCDEAGRVRRVSVKVPLSGDPVTRHAIIGAFWFRKGRFFTESTREMIRAGSRIKGEFYIDECMNFAVKSGLDVRVFEVDRYVSWGTPADLKTHEYWETFFDAASFHPYRRKAPAERKA